MSVRRRPSNEEVASQLEEAASVLRADGADRYRVRAYLAAAQTVRALREPVWALAEREGRAGLLELPAIGPHLAQRIEEIALRREPISEQLSIFDDDEPAAPEPRTEPARAVRDLFESQPPPPSAGRPSVAQLLTLDHRFRARAAEAEAGPRLGGEWLPTWQVEERGLRFSVHFSTSGSAHRMGRTHDWVVIAYDLGGVPEQATVVTEYRGPLAGRRVVRGRERECLRHWAKETERELARERWRRTGS